jgi:hypothetical protein
MAVQAVADRPSLLGLDVENNLRKMVEYLLENDYTQEQVIEYITTTL